jgi:tetratricopeptide (TPR) repeat protein
MQEGLTGKPADALLYNYMAAALFAQKKPEEALAALNKSKEIKPDYFTPYFNIAAFYSSKAEYDKAIAEYQSVLEIDPKNLKALLTAAALYELKGDETSALEYFIKASQTKDPRGFLALSQYYLRAKKYDEAPKALDSALQLYPDNPAILEMKARLLIKKGATAEAAPVLKNLEKSKPGRGIPLLVKAYLENGETEKAVALAKDIISKNSKASYGYLLLSDIYLNKKDYAAAEKALETGLQNSRQKDLVLKMRLGNVYEKVGKPELANRIYLDMEKKYPKNSQAAFARASLSDRSGNKREALKLYQDILENDGNNAPSLNNLAYLYAENYSNPEKALELAMKAYRKTPNSPEIMDTLGYVLLLNNKPDQAFKLLKKASAMLPNNPTVNYHMALACKANNKPDQAAQLLEKALKKGNFPEQEAAKKLLTEL